LVQSGLVDITENAALDSAPPGAEEVDESDEVVRRTSALAAALTGRGRPPLWPLRRGSPDPVLDGVGDETPEERRLRLRKAAAAELAASHAAAEEERRARLAAKAGVDVVTEPEPNAAEADAEAQAEAEAQAQAQEEARQRVEAEEQAWIEHESWLVAQRAAAQALERAAAEEPAWVEHAAWLAAERTAAEEPAWAEHAVWLEMHQAPEPIAEPEPEPEPVLEPVPVAISEPAEEPPPGPHELILMQRRAALEETAWAEHRAWLAAQVGTEEHQAHVEAAAELTEWVSMQESSPAQEFVFYGDPLDGDVTDQNDSAADPEPEPDPEPLEPVQFADTASLLRELSSLQHDDSAPPQPAPTVTRPIAAPPPKRRKGLFGR
jgi:hypothetical protein